MPLSHVPIEEHSEEEESEYESEVDEVEEELKAMDIDEKPILVVEKKVA